MSASIPIFSDFSDGQLLELEQKATFSKYICADIVFKQYEEGSTYQVTHLFMHSLTYSQVMHFM